MSIRLTRASRDVDRVAGIDDVDDLLGVAIDQCDLAGIAQRYREQVLDIVLVHFLIYAFVGWGHQLPATTHLGHTPLRRGRRLMLQVTRHHVDLSLAHLARRSPVRHTGWRAISNEGFQVNAAACAGNVCGQRLAGRTLAQYAVAAGAALEVNLLGGFEFIDCHRWALGIDHVHGGRRIDTRGGTFVTGFCLTFGLGKDLRCG